VQQGAERRFLRRTGLLWQPEDALDRIARICQSAMATSE
jgi:hypothetical protein